IEQRGFTNEDQSLENQELPSIDPVAESENQETQSQESASLEDLSEQEILGVEGTPTQEEEVDSEQSGELGNNKEEISDAEGNIPNPNPVGEENPKGGELEVITYPNPVIEGFSIYIKNFENEHAQYQLFDPQGRQLESNRITDKTTKIRIAHLSAATYLLWVFVSNQPIKTFKIVKK
ncbi:MAG: T9SS type A sorting domain-containing protein, partial [Pricia sp.]|nr:T9SS type A sorting domain-containing protein [Pricia sp.]